MLRLRPVVAYAHCVVLLFDYIEHLRNSSLAARTEGESEALRQLRFLTSGVDCP
jgi:hypothetical protein